MGLLQGTRPGFLYAQSFPSLFKYFLLFLLKEKVSKKFKGGAIAPHARPAHRTTVTPHLYARFTAVLSLAIQVQSSCVSSQSKR
jgi:hypothetical protein